MDSEPTINPEAVLDVSNNKTIAVLEKYGYLKGGIEIGVAKNGLSVKEDKNEGSLNIIREGLVKERFNLHARDEKNGQMFSRLLRSREKPDSSGNIEKEEVSLDIDTDPIGKPIIDPEMVTVHFTKALYHPDKVWHDRLHNEKTDLLVHADKGGNISKIYIAIHDNEGKMAISANCDPRKGEIKDRQGNLNEAQLIKLFSDATDFKGSGLPKSINLDHTIKALAGFTDPNKSIGKGIVFE